MPHFMAFVILQLGDSLSPWHLYYRTGGHSCSNGLAKAKQVRLFSSELLSYWNMNVLCATCMFQEIEAHVRFCTSDCYCEL